MYLCRSQRVWFPVATESLLEFSTSIVSFVAPQSPAQRMCLMRMVRRARAALWWPGYLLLTCLLLDSFFQACLYEAALIPALRDNSSSTDSANLSSEHPPSSSSSSSSVSSLVAVPSPAAALPSSSPSSSSLSLHNSETNSSSYKSLNKTETFLSYSQHNSSSNSPARSNSSSSSNNNGSSSSNNNGSSSSNNNGSGGNNNGSGSSNNTKDSPGRSSSPSQNQEVSSYHTDKPPREFPFALVVASSTAAVSILLFFCLSYVWHTRQLDHRAQKMAIRLAAESEQINCSQCRTPTTYLPGSSQDSGTDSGGEEVLPDPPPLLPPSSSSSSSLPRPSGMAEELNSLNEEDEDEMEGEDGSRRKPGGVGRTLGSRRGRRGKRSGSRSSRKWSAHSGGPNRSSLVTDKEILNHFASRRHSTFFI